jgi:hypothetical protein
MIMLVMLVASVTAAAGSYLARSSSGGHSVQLAFIQS